MRKRMSGYREWKKNKDKRKHNHELYRKNKRKIKKYNYRQSRMKKHINKEHIIDFPSDFRLHENTKKVIDIFNEVIETTDKHGFNHNKRLTMIFNLKNITKLSIESIMYLLALIKNIRKNKMKNIRFVGNFPKDIKANQLFVDSGFIKYVKSDAIKFKEDSNIISIENGTKVEPTIAAKVIGFIKNHLKVNLSKNKQNALYEMLIELMSNTYDHAYDNDSRLYKQWYLYVVSHNNKIKLTFLDTGQGIPKTIYKKIHEKLTSNQGKLMKSAFEGKPRTETQQINRGRGLPKIYEYLKTEIIKNLYVIAGKGFCSSNGDMFFSSANSINSDLEGTIFYWEVE